jgi:hypothetical protein
MPRRLPRRICNAACASSDRSVRAFLKSVHVSLCLLCFEQMENYGDDEERAELARQRALMPRILPKQWSHRYVNVLCLLIGRLLPCADTTPCRISLPLCGVLCGRPCWVCQCGSSWHLGVQRRGRGQQPVGGWRLHEGEGL